jgi:hypothetical protein
MVLEYHFSEADSENFLETMDAGFVRLEDVLRADFEALLKLFYPALCVPCHSSFSSLEYAS